MTKPAYIITGPTSGFGRRTALELSGRGTINLVGRDRGRLDAMRKEVPDLVAVVCDLSDLRSVRRAADEIVALGLPLAALINNAGAVTAATKTAQGFDATCATNYLGPFALTEALVPHLPDGANVVFLASGVEDRDRKPATMAGYRGGRGSDREFGFCPAKSDRCSSGLRSRAGWRNCG